MKDICDDHDVESKVIERCEEILQIDCNKIQLSRLLLEPDTGLSVSQIAIFLLTIESDFETNISIDDFNEDTLTISKIIDYCIVKFRSCIIQRNVL